MIELCLSDLKALLFNPHRFSQWRECHVQLTFILFCKCKECHHQNRLSCVLSLLYEQKKSIYCIFSCMSCFYTGDISLNKCQCEFVILFNRAAATQRKSLSVSFQWFEKRSIINAALAQRHNLLIHWFNDVSSREIDRIVLSNSSVQDLLGCVSFFFVIIESKVINLWDVL